MDHFEFNKILKVMFMNEQKYSDEECNRFCEEGWKKITAKSFMDEAIYLFALLNGRKVDGSRYWIHNEIMNQKYHNQKFDLHVEFNNAYGEALRRCSDKHENEQLVEYFRSATQTI